MQIGRQIQYSQTGKTLAKTFNETASATSYASSANKVLWDGFDTLVKSNETTEDEKAIAKMANAIAKNTLNVQEHNRIAFPIMRAISNSISGPVGVVLAQISLNAANNTEKAESANKVLWSGYNAIINNPAATEDEKAIAKLGDNIANNTLNIQEHNRIAFPIMRSIAGSVGGPIGTVLAQVTHKAASNTEKAESANQVIWAGYDAIINNPQSTEQQKAIAKFGDKISHHTMNIQEHNRIGFSIISSLENPDLDGPMGNTLAKVAYNAASDTKLAVSANNVLWDGFEAVLNNPESTEIQKSIAKEAINISHNTMNVQEHNRIAFKMMKSIMESK
jgi:hypothetical protein